MLVALVPLAAGIVCGTFFEAPFWLWAAACAICGTAAWFCREQKWFFAIYLTLTVVSFGAAAARANTPRAVTPQGKRLWIELQITDNLAVTGRDPGSFGQTDSTRRRSPGTVRTSGVVVGTGEKLLVGIDTMWRFKVGDRVIFRGYINPIDTLSTSYSRLMRTRGYVGRTYITRFSQPRIVPDRPSNGFWKVFGGKNLSVFAKKLQAAATERLWRLAPENGRSQFYLTNENSKSRPDAALEDGRLHPGAATEDCHSNPKIGAALREMTTENILSDQETGVKHPLSGLKIRAKHPDFTPEIAVAAAMTTGDRSGITPEIRQAYSRTGASHLLAVSGLHVGIIFLIINILLYFLPLLPHGHIAKNIAAVVAIWGYAVLTGLSPSATRAAVMFSGAQVALAMSRTRNSINIMCGTAFLMLAIRPGLLFDISFQLSFIAVAAIIAWFRPLYALVESRFRLLNALWATLIVGLVASVATLPLVSHVFGIFSVVGIVLNPLVIGTAYLIIIFSVIWILAPVPMLEPVFRWLVGGPAWLQNSAIEAVSRIPGVAIEWQMPLWMVFAIYAAMIIFAAIFAARKPPAEVPLNLSDE